MNTEALIDALARGPVSADGGAPRRRLLLAAGGGGGLALAASLWLLGLRPDLASAAATPMFWLKLAFPALLAVLALFATSQLGRPGAPAATAPMAIAALLLLLEVAAVGVVAATPIADRAALVAGRTAWSCVASILMLSLPVLVALVVALRGLAPTRLRTAGFAAGLAAGAIAASAYALHCDEASLPFLAVWYMVGIALPGALGALSGPRLLRWG